jgi:hypothetical protein
MDQHLPMAAKHDFLRAVAEGVLRRVAKRDAASLAGNSGCCATVLLDNGPPERSWGQTGSTEASQSRGSFTGTATFESLLPSRWSAAAALKAL